MRPPLLSSRSPAAPYFDYFSVFRRSLLQGLESLDPTAAVEVVDDPHQSFRFTQQMAPRYENAGGASETTGAILDFFLGSFEGWGRVGRVGSWCVPVHPPLLHAFPVADEYGVLSPQPAPPGLPGLNPSSSARA